MRVVMAFMALVLAVSSGQVQHKSVYNRDNREDFYLSSLRDQEIIRNQTVAFILKTDLGSPNEYGVYHAHETKNLLVDELVCETERFAFEPIAAKCSGTLIGVDRVLTAGNCVKDFCDPTMAIVFDYYAVDGNGLMGQVYGKDDVYECRRIFKNVDKTRERYDYAVIQLDRPVRGRTPARVAPLYNSDMSLYRAPRGTALKMYGNPYGLPAKSDTGGFVVFDLDTSEEELFYFEGTVGGFKFGHGSGVYDSSNQVIGVLSKTSTDYNFGPGSPCKVVYVRHCAQPKCADLTEAERITYAAPAAIAAPACTQHSDCRSGLSGDYCDLSCTLGEMCCTGWCVKFEDEAHPRNYDPSHCESFFNYTLKDVYEPPPSPSRTSSPTISTSPTISITPTFSSSSSVTSSASPSLNHIPPGRKHKPRDKTILVVSVCGALLGVVALAVVCHRLKKKRAHNSQVREDQSFSRLPEASSKPVVLGRHIPNN